MHTVLNPTALPDVPTEPGTYALVLRCTMGRTIRVGRLGTMRLRPGYYVYIGSALGPGGLRARIAHHLRRTKRPHWHIDYLRTHVRVGQLWYCCNSIRLEHHWAQVLGGASGGFIARPGFGASDCDCESHLYFFKRRPSPLPPPSEWKSSSTSWTHRAGGASGGLKHAFSPVKAPAL